MKINYERKIYHKITTKTYRANIVLLRKFDRDLLDFVKKDMEKNKSIKKKKWHSFISWDFFDELDDGFNRLCKEEAKRNIKPLFETLII